MCEELKPVTREEAYRTLRLLALRMAEVARQEHRTSETVEEAHEQFKWAVAIDKLLDACDCLR